MSASYALGRLLWRPATIWSVLVLIGIAQGLTLLHGLVISTFPWLTPVHSRLGASGFLIVNLLLAPLFAGMLATDAMRSIEHCPVSFTLPGLRRGLRRACAVCALFVAALCAQAIGNAPVAAVVVFGTSVFWFAIGLLLFDPGLPRLLRIAAFVIALLGFLNVEWFFVWILGSLHWTTGAAAAVLALGCAWGAFRLRFGVAAARAHALTPSWALPTGMRPSARQQTYSARSLERLPKDFTWSVAAIGDRTDGWVRAALYETYGSRPGGWWRRALIACLGIVIAVVIVGFVEGFADDGSVRRGFEFLWRSLAGRRGETFGVGGPRPPYESIAAFSALGMIGAQVTARDLHAGLLHPIGRAARARAVWGLALVANLGQALLLVLVLSILAEVLRRALGGPAPHFGYMRAVCVAVVTLPALQVAIARVFAVRAKRPSPLARLLVVSALSIAFMVVLMLLVRGCEDAERELGLLPVLGAGLAVFAFGQWALRAWLARWYARCDLL